MKILVTGAGGFIGTNLCLHLLKKKHQVVAIDILFKHEIKNPNYLPILHDIINLLEIEVDQIYHLACHASPIRYQKNPIHTFKTCVLGTLHLLELARKLQVPLLLASTSEVYGMAHQIPQKESYWGNVNPIGVRSCYNEGKRGAESLCMDYYRQYETDVKIVRIFNTYGPFLDPEDGRAIPSFVSNALQSQYLQIYGDGKQTRSFMYVDDLIRGMELMIQSKDLTGPVNLGNPEEISILNLAKTIIELTQSSSQVRFSDGLPDDPHRRRPDIQLAMKSLGWKPEITLNEGLKKTITYFSKMVSERNVQESLRSSSG